MDFGVCILSIVPVRNEPSDKSEMVTQLLFGDLSIITGIRNGWVGIRKVYDNYEGWVDKKQLQFIDEEEFSKLNNAKDYFVTEMADIITDLSSDTMIPVVVGSTIRNFSNNEFEIAGTKYKYTGQLSIVPAQTVFTTLYENALVFLNAPYLWGGLTPFGLDCSGFIQSVFKLSGININRDASQQATQGEDVSFLEEAKPGDLIFFDNEEGQIVHVGILLPDKKIIHASGKVRIDQIDHQGIYNAELKSYSHKLRLIKRIL
ncbi:MAG: C40 family peptidase [Bacteroidales bacterium]|nr:C40 family peptidase [Bacteroidales bacterium]MCF8403400.1 C40 family peptidase [Bacteroidales bacterium]